MTWVFRTACLVSCIAMGGAAAQGRELIYNSLMPPDSVFNKPVMANMISRIEEQTKGELTVQFNTGGALAGFGDALSAASSGALDVNYIVYAFAESNLPTLGLINAMYVRDPLVAGPAAAETVLLNCPQCEAEQERNNIRIISNVTTEPLTFICADAEGITKMEDLKGKRVRSASSAGALIAEAGGTPVNISTAEIYSAMQRGQVDCTINVTANLEDFQLWEVAKSITNVSLGTSNGLGMVVFNKSVWESLTPEHRRVWLDSAAKALAELQSIYPEEYARVRERATTERDVAFLEPAPGLQEGIEEFRARELPKLVERAKTQGVENPEAIVENFSAAISKWTAIVDEIGTNRPWNEEQKARYAERIQDEIYGKIAVE